MATRPAAKGEEGWYDSDPGKLGPQLDGFFNLVPEIVDGSRQPILGARVVIAPHAGYAFSGKCAAWAYSCLDLSKAKRVFVLGPAHTRQHAEGCAVSTFDKYATPFGDFTVDKACVKEIKETGELKNMLFNQETKEHSLEMHMPYLYKACARAFPSPEKYPSIVPICVASLDRDEEKDMGQLLLPYLKDPENAFVISSDFCHWGGRFQYTAYSPDMKLSQISSRHGLSEYGRKPIGAPIHESIRLVDEAAMEAVESASHDAFVDNLAATGNTVCGRHPIGVMMAALELLNSENEDGNKTIEENNKGSQIKGRFKVINYDRSELVEWPYQSSVSYVSAYAVL